MAHATAAQASTPERRSGSGWLYLQVIVAIIAGGLIGYFEPAWGQALQPLSIGFVKLVKMVIGPVIFLTVATGVAGMADLTRLRGLALKTLLYFLVVSTLALMVGLIVANVIRPGEGMNVNPASLDTSAITSFTSAAHDQTVIGFLLNIIPTTVFSAFADGEILQILLVSVLFGVGMAMAGDAAKPFLNTLESAAAGFFNVVRIVMRAAPIGAFGAFAFTIGKYGIASIVHLAALVGVFYATSALFVLIVLGAITAANGFSILRLLGYLRNELVLVFGTSSSEAALPSLIGKLEQAGASKPVVGVVVPTGYSFNLDGTNIYMTLAALFIAQATGVHLDLGQQLLLLAVAMISSKGAAGVTGAGFITLAATLAVVPTIPVAGIVLVLGVDRFMSECRALTNIIGNAVATIVIARWEKELDSAAFHAALGGKAPAAANAPRRWGIAVGVSALVAAVLATGALVVGPQRIATQANALIHESTAVLQTNKH